METIPSSKYKRMPWKNGGGTTAEIARFPEGEGPFDWRLSQADIQQDGPFSAFPGYERLLCVFKGNAIQLGSFKLEPLEPIQFSGRVTMDCKLLKGPVSDLGLIFDPSKVNAEMNIVDGSVELQQSGLHYFYELDSGNTRIVKEAGRVEVAKSIMVSIFPA